MVKSCSCRGGSIPSTHMAAHSQGKLGVVVYTFNSSTRKAEDIWEEDVILVYVASSRPGEATGLDFETISKRKRKERLSRIQRNRNFCALLY